MGDVIDFKTVTMGERVAQTVRIEGVSGSFVLERLNRLEHARSVLFDIERGKSVEGIEIEKAMMEVSEVIELKFLLK